MSRLRSAVTRERAVPALVLILGLVAIAAITVFQLRSSASRDAELKLAGLKLDLARLQTAPFRADPNAGGSPTRARAVIDTQKAKIAATLGEIEGASPPAALGPLRGILTENYAVIEQIYTLGSTVGYGPEADKVAANAVRTTAAAVAVFDEAGREYDQRATKAQLEATVGSGVVIGLLLVAFGVLYRRASRARRLAEGLVRENHGLLAASRQEALVDELTGLRNRRALTRDMELELARATADRPMLLALFDLDGFKQYNDTFGHAAGDDLLRRLGGRLTAAVERRATAYRMGGDEFCLLVGVGTSGQEDIARIASEALTEEGDVFSIGCSYGVTRVPTEATSAAEALLQADQRMYAHKTGRSSAGRQTADVLLKVLRERADDLEHTLSDVTLLALRTAEGLGLPEHEVKRIGLAAELHDVGKTALPDAILRKPAGLDEGEWAFMRRHTLIGERIVLAAPSLAHTADLVRSSHERTDGLGYPDGLHGDQIPLGASVIAVCDAFDAMVVERPYSAAVPVSEALAELRRCAGTQFHAVVVEAFCTVVAEDEEGVLRRTA